MPPQTTQKHNAGDYKHRRSSFTLLLERLEALQVEAAASTMGRDLGQQAAATASRLAGIARHDTAAEWRGRAGAGAGAGFGVAGTPSLSGTFESAGEAGKKTRLFCRHFILKMIISPRQARDKHSESTQKEMGFLTDRCWQRCTSSATTLMISRRGSVAEHNSTPVTRRRLASWTKRRSWVRSETTGSLVLNLPL